METVGEVGAVEVEAALGMEVGQEVAVVKEMEVVEAEEVKAIEEESAVVEVVTRCQLRELKSKQKIDQRVMIV